MKQIRLVAAVAAAFVSAGCFQMASTITVNADGSGTIAQRLVFTRAAIEQLKQLGTLSGAKGAELDPLSEDQARAEAGKLGSGVTYVSSTRIDDAKGQGRETIYSFKDISQLRMNQQPQLPGGTVRSDSLDAMKQAVGFAMSRTENGNALLTISMPEPRLDHALSFGGQANAPSPEQLAMARQMFAGARVNIGIETAGPLVRTSSPYVTGNHVTLLDVDFDQLMTDSALERLRTVTSADDLRQALKDVPGVTLSLDPQITIEFKSR